MESFKIEPRCSGTTIDRQIAKTSKPSLNDRRKIVSFDQFVFSVDRFLGLFYAGHFPRHVFDSSAIRGFQKTLQMRSSSRWLTNPPMKRLVTSDLENQPEIVLELRYQSVHFSLTMKL